MNIELKVAITILMALISAIAWLFSKFEKIKERNHLLELEIKDLEKKIDIQNKVMENIKSNSDTFITLLREQLNK
ncbi:MAG: hypothetical protein Q3983_05065 [Capnocytophaga sp.]|nr:hypothetical protein [Capnocytophaga sp.]